MILRANPSGAEAKESGRAANVQTYPRRPDVPIDTMPHLVAGVA